MANLLSILRRRPDEIARLSQQDYLAQLATVPLYPGSSTLYSVGRRPVEMVPNSYLGYAEAAYASCTVVGACMRVRRDIFSQARFTWRELTDDGTGPLSHDGGLDLLERPWPNGTTGQLLTKMITDVDLCGNAYIVNEGDRLRWRRPDWMFVALSGDPNVDDSVDVLGYIYTPGGCGLGDGRPYTVEEVAHWAPIPRPGSEYVGMSWMTSALREIQADKHATEHKLNFFVNGATLGPVFRLPATMTAEQFGKFRQANEEAHAGVENAYKPLYVGGGAEVTLSAATFQQLELKATQGAGETRIAALAGVHPAIVGLSEGLSGSSLNAGNFGAARRLVADITLHKLWQDACATLASFVDVPDGKELWIRERAIPFLREDAKDAAEIFAVDAQSATMLVREGYRPETVTPAVSQRNITMLEHSGALSVQLQEPGAQPPEQRSQVIDGEVVVRAIEGRLDELVRRAPYPGQRYRHGWIPVAGPLEVFDERMGTALSGPAALDRPPLGLGPGIEGGIEDTGGVLAGRDPQQVATLTAAIHAYRSDQYAAINGGLRDGDLSPRDAASVAGIDSLMAVSRLDRDIEVHRGVGDPEEVFGSAWNERDVTGLAWHDRGYTSTTADPRVARDIYTGDVYGQYHSGRAGVAMRVLVPAGTGAIRLSDERGEAEIALQRDLDFRVVRDHGYDDDGIRQLDVEVVPA